MEQLIIDRFEGEFAVCETEERKQLLLPRKNLPQGAQEGDCLLRDENGVLHADPETTQARRKLAIERTRRLFATAREDEDDIVL